MELVIPITSHPKIEKILVIMNSKSDPKIKKISVLLAVVVILFVGDEITFEESDPACRSGAAGDQPSDHRGGGRQRQNSGQNHRQNADPSL